MNSGRPNIKFVLLWVNKQMQSVFQKLHSKLFRKHWKNKPLKYWHRKSLQLRLKNAKQRLNSKTSHWLSGEGIDVGRLCARGAWKTDRFPGEHCIHRIQGNFRTSCQCSVIRGNPRIDSWIDPVCIRIKHKTRGIFTSDFSGSNHVDFSHFPYWFRLLYESFINWCTYFNYHTINSRKCSKLQRAERKLLEKYLMRTLIHLFTKSVLRNQREWS